MKRNGENIEKEMRQAFKELLALSPEELAYRLKSRKIGTIAKVIKEIEEPNPFRYVSKQEYRYIKKAEKNSTCPFCEAGVK